MKNAKILIILIWNVVLFLPLLAQKPPTENRNLEMIEDEIEPSYRLFNMRVSVETRVPLALYKVNYKVQPDSPARMAEQYLKIRKQNTEAIIEHLQGVRLRELREDARRRNTDIRTKAKRIIYFIEKNLFQQAEVSIMGMRNLNVVKGEPDYLGFHGWLTQALDSVTGRTGGDPISRMNLILVKADESDFLHALIARYRDELVKRELRSYVPINREAVLKDVFLLFIKDAQLLRGSPHKRAIWWARLYQAAQIPLNIYSPKKKTKREANPTFKAASKYTSILESYFIEDALNIRWVSSMRFSGTRGFLEKIKHVEKRKHLIREDLPGLVKILAKDCKLNAEQTSILKKCVWQEPRQFPYSSSPITDSIDNNGVSQEINS